MFGGENGAGFAGWNGKDDGSVIVLSYLPESTVDDPYGLDGKSYALVKLLENRVSGGAITTEIIDEGRKLAAKEVFLRSDPVAGEDVLLVAIDSDIPFWTFHSVSGETYYITTIVNQSVKYLKITDQAITLSNSLDDDCMLTVKSGTGVYSGKIRISNSDNYAVNLYNHSIENGFGPWNDEGTNEWFALATRSEITEDDFVSYSAEKVSVSDTTKIANKEKVIIYTRVWNQTKKEYEYFIVDHDGTLVQAYENGDSLRWVGNKVNSAIWEFTEYYYEGTTTPNHYYELQNKYSGKYLAPQINGGQTLSDNPIGINLNGRRYGDYYSTILAWDDPYYDYAGITTSNGSIGTGRVLGTSRKAKMRWGLFLKNKAEKEKPQKNI